MRKNVKKQLALRVLSTAALVAMVSSIATAAFADTYDLNTGSVTVETKADGITYVTQKDDKQVDGYARNEKNDILHDYQDKTGVTITSGGRQTSNTITVETAKDQTTDVTLEDVFINREGARNSDSEAALTVKGDGDTNIELNGNNTLSSTGAHAGLEKTDAECSGTLTITDDKNDGKNGGSDKKKDEYGYSTGGDTGTLAVIGGGQGGASIADRAQTNIGTLPLTPVLRISTVLPTSPSPAEAFVQAKPPRDAIVMIIIGPPVRALAAAMPITV